MLKFNKLAGAVAMVLASASAMALPSFQGGYNEINFVAYENQYRSVASCAAGGCVASSGTEVAGFLRVDGSIAGNVRVEDLFIGVFQVSFVNSNPLSIFPNTGGEFTGYFVHRIDAIVPGSGANVNLQLTPGVDPFGKLASNELFAFYTDAGSNFDQTGVTVGQSINTATDGVKWAGLSLDGGGNTYAYTSTDLLQPANQKSGSFFSALNIVNKGASYNVGPVNPVNDPDEVFYGGAATGTPGHLCSAADIAGGVVSCTDIFSNADVKTNNSFNATNPASRSPWFFQVNDPVVLDAVVPEPASLALAGVALLALGAARRKRSA